ncbi:MAG: hypothetical protein C4521_06665 [Actinobacteria bacterium]|nr:MAG: hypothetical protein C4521_06665 [Actinomycetota bacterium]
MRKRYSIAFAALTAVVAFLSLAVLQAGAHELTGNGTWYWQNPKPQGNSVYDTVFTSPTRGWAVGAAGTALHTEDGGAHWTSDYSGTGEHLYAADFVNDNKGWAVGSRGVIVHTDDGGAHWTEQDSGGGPSVYLYAVDFVSETVGWAVGVDLGGVTGVILYTGTGGETWTEVTPGVMSSLYDIAFTSPSDGWIVGYGGKMLHTTDGGAHWNNVASGTFNTLRRIVFTSASEAWAVGHNGTIVHSDDGGGSWAAQDTGGSPNHIYDVAFIDATEGFATTVAGQVFHTTDGGSTWNLDSPVGATWPTYYSVCFSDASNGWITGDGGSILRTSSGGAAWAAQTNTQDAPMKAISAVDTNTAWAVDYASIRATADGGNLWTTQDTSSTWLLTDIDMAGGTRGWVVGFDGLIRRTEDGGASWLPQTSEATQALLALDATSDTTAWACGDNGLIVATADGGANWVTQRTGEGEELADIFFFNDDLGWAAGRYLASDEPLILRTSDGGQTWAAQDTGDAYNGLLSVVFTSETEGWATGYYGQVLRTVNGGTGWILQPALSWDALEAVWFTSPDEGWIVGQSGCAMQTIDGASWELRQIGTGNYLTDVEFADGQTGWAVGWQGTILSTIDPDWQTTPPHNVRNFDAVPGDDSVSLSWVNPTDVHYAATRILRSETGFASTPTETAGQAQIYEGTSTAFFDAGLTNYTDYFYTVFTRNDAGCWSLPATAAGRPYEPAPGPITAFQGVPWDRQVSLSWANPSDDDYASTRLLRSETGFAASPTDTAGQTQIYEGTATAFIDGGLANYTTYFYTAYACDDADVWSVAATLTAQPFDPPPGPVTGFSATAGDGSVDLAWTNPSDPDYAATRVLRSTAGYATEASETAGQTQVYEGPAEAAADTGVTNGVTYYYTAFARDTAGGWSPAASASARPKGATTLLLTSPVALASYGEEISLAGSLTNGTGPIPATLAVTLWRSCDGGAKWAKVATARYDWATHTYKASAIMICDSLFQMQFAGDLANVSCISNAVAVESKAYLGKPIAPSTVRRYAYFNTYGLLLPGHSSSVTLYFYRYLPGTGWSLYTQRTAAVSNYTFYSKHSTRYRLPYRGLWCVKAYHADACHADSWSAATYINVR